MNNNCISKLKYYIFSIFFSIIFVDLINGQNEKLSNIRLNFNVRWEREIDSAYINPSNVIGFIFYDSCYSRKFVKRFNKLADSLTSLKYIRIDGPLCSKENDTLVYSLFNLYNLTTIYDIWGDCFKYYSINYPKSFEQRIVNIETRCPGSINCREWQLKIYKFNNLVDLSLNFAKKVEIAPEIVHLTHLEGLKLSGLGDIQFPPNFHRMENLKEIDLSHCIKCKNLPDTLPVSIEKINIYTTSIEKLPSNLCDLKNITHLNIGCSKIKEFPKDFNFRRLHYFSAEESLFSPEEWERIKKEVFTVVTTCSSKGKSNLPKRG